MIRLMLMIGIAAHLVACSTPIKLDNVPVVDRSSSMSTAATGDSGTSKPGGQSTVATVNAAAVNAGALAQATGNTVYFEYDSFVIRPEFQGLIVASAKRLQSDQAHRFAIEGHTDERGGREYNLALGQKRADAVRRALSLLGVPESRMESVSFGKEKPAVLGLTDAAMEKNRRAEISIR